MRRSLPEIEVPAGKYPRQSWRAVWCIQSFREPKANLQYCRLLSELDLVAALKSFQIREFPADCRHVLKMRDAKQGPIRHIAKERYRTRVQRRSRERPEPTIGQRRDIDFLFGEMQSRVGIQAIRGGGIRPVLCLQPGWGIHSDSHPSRAT